MTDKEIAQELFGREMPERSMGAMEALGKGIGAALEGFAKGVEIAGNVLYGDGMQHFAGHGAHEIANALFNNSGYVMYPRSSHDNGVHGPEQEQQQEHQQERGGREI